MKQIIFVDPDKHCRFCKNSGLESDGSCCTFCAKGQALRYELAKQGKPSFDVFAAMEPLGDASWEKHCAWMGLSHG